MEKKSSLRSSAFHIFVALFMLIGTSVMAQVTNTNTAATFTTLTAAINDPATLPGHTLMLTASYTEGIVYVNKAVIINGAGFTLTSTSGIYGVEVASANVTISNLTVTASGTFGIQADCGSDALALTNVTVNACGGTGIAVNGSDNVVITNLTSTNNVGNGISITNCDNLSIVGITTSGNAFSPGGFGAGIGLFTSNIYCLPAGINGFSLTGTVSIAENPKVYSQKATATDVITGLSGASIMWAVGTSASDRTYWPNKATAYFVVDALFEAPYFFPNTSVFVEEVATDNLYVDDNPNADAVPPMLINTAIAAAQPGKSIFLEAGTFIEHVVIPKSLTIDGATMATSILDGTTVGGTGSGISVNNGITNVTIRDLTVRNYALSGSNDAGIAALLSNNNFSVISCDVYSNSGGRGGVYVNGPVTNVLIDSVKAHDHPSGSRGIVVWNGLKSNITITNCEVYNNNCCGIELQDGTASGVNISNNNVHDNADNGLGLSGMNGATGSNLIRKNIVSNNGRFGIEVKNPKGTSATSGTGSILVDSNTVSLTATVGMNIRDHAGIAIFRRAFQSGNPDGYPNIPTGVVLQYNTVSGYTHLNPGRVESEGFGIVVEGTNHKVLNNTVNTSNIGIQEQGGAHPNPNYVADNAGDGNQNDGSSASYFGRGNTPVACGNIISGNTFSGNTTNQRTSTGAGSFGLVTNTNTGETFCSIQAAIDDAQTLNGHTITVAAGTFNEQVLINKEVTIKNATNVRPVINFTGTPALVSGAKTLFEVTAPNVTIDSLEFSVDVTKLGSAILASSATLNNLTVIDNSINPYRSAPATLSFGLRNAISVNVSPRVNSNNPTMLIQNNTITYNIGVDLAPGTADDAGFRSGVATDEGGGTITLNTITTISHDVIVRFGGNPAGMSITSNNFNGGGVELSDQNAACGPMVVSGNTFTGAGAPNTAMLRLKNNYDGITHTISSNTFTNHEWAISSENMKAVTFNANTFNTASATAHALVINTKSISTNSAAIVQIALAATITNNNFNGAGNAITFLNHDSDNDSYGTITLGTAGNENNFAATLTTFIVFDSQTGVSSGSVFPNYTATIGAGAGALTTMAYWDTDIDATNNKFDVGTGLKLPSVMTKAELYDVEDRNVHAIEIGGLGFANVKTNNTYVTPISFKTSITTTPSVQRGIDELNPSGTVNIKAGTTYTGGADATGLGKNVTLSPGSSPACVTIAGNMVLNGGDILDIEANGTTVCTQYDQFTVNGTVTLGGSTLMLTLGYTPGIGDQFTIISNDNADAVTGMFAEGFSITTGGYTFDIDYAGGDGNDVVLTRCAGGVTNTSTGKIFCSIQDAINDPSTVAGNTISVAAGTYAEDIIVNKSLSIFGPNAAINPCSGTRVAEAKIVPGTADIVLREIMHVAASNVTISGFTIDGDNPLLTSGFTSTNGADIDAAEGVTVYETGINNLTVSNNIIQNLSYFGVTLYDYPAGVPSSGHVISNNKIRDLGTYDATSTIDYWGGGVLLYNNQYAAVTDNCMTNVRLGVQTGNFYQANPGLAASQFITGNSIQARRIGVFHNLHYSAASAYTISNNSFTGLANANESGVRGIELASLSVPSFCVDNTINLSGVSTNTTGYEIWNVKNTFPASITGGTVSNVNTGIFANNYEGYNSDAPDGANATVTAITITPNAAGTGVRVLDSPGSTSHANVALNVTNSFITGGTDGVKFEGLSVNGPINNNSITGNSNKSINATSYTGVPAIDVTCNWYGSAVAAVVATEVTGNVTHIPYLNNGTDNSAAQGFQPVPGSCLGVAVTLSIAQTPVLCFGGNTGTATVTVLTGLAPYTYLWNTMQTTSTAVNLVAGTYTVTVADANGSTASASIAVTQPAAALTATCSVTNVSCFGLADGTAQVVAAGGTAPYTYLWNTMAATTSLSGLVAGSYTVTVTDANLCTATCIATVTQPGEILITCSQNSTPCAGGGTTANVCASATNGAGPFTYLWNTGATTACLSDVAAGTYTVTVTNTANGCTKTKSITVN